MNNKPHISVIVPVYKVEQYLDECVQSIINQTYKNLEIILVDDGSPDRCPEMCDEYAKQDSRIKVIHKKNGGISSARNAGIAVATGEYIGFVDSDDFIAVDMYEKLYSSFEGERDDVFLVKCNVKSVVGGKIVSTELNWNKTPSIIPSKEYFNRLLSYSFLHCAWNLLIKKKYVTRWFEEGRNNEDFLWHYHLGYDIEKNNLSVKLITDELYYYRHSENSITNDKKVPFDLSVIDNSFYMYNDAKERGKTWLAERLYVSYSAHLCHFIFIMTHNPLWRNKYFTEYHKKLFGLDWSVLRKYWAKRHLAGLFIATFFPRLLFVPIIYRFITKNGDIPPF